MVKAMIITKMVIWQSTDKFLTSLFAHSFCGRYLASGASGLINGSLILSVVHTTVFYDSESSLFRRQHHLSLLASVAASAAAAAC